VKPGFAKTVTIFMVEVMEVFGDFNWLPDYVGW
jgi:hypothetical protein